jgi:hypothetical protein
MSFVVCVCVKFVLVEGAHMQQPGRRVVRTQHGANNTNLVWPKDVVLVVGKGWCGRR